jgi:hypothetical protein
MKRWIFIFLAIFFLSFNQAFSQKELKKTFQYVRYFDHATKQWSSLKPGENTFIFINEPITNFSINYQSGKVENFEVLSTLFQNENDNGEPFTLAAIKDAQGNEGILNAHRNDFGYIKTISISFNDYWLSIQFLNK